MTDISRLGLGCMGMNFSNEERSIETVHYALDHGITMFNTGEFYGGGESEMVLREALKGVPRDRYFLSVKFGVLQQPGGHGMYGLDVDPFHVRAHLNYSLHRLGVDYVDLYQPARMDETVPVEDLMKELSECEQEGYIRSIGLTQLTAADLERAAKVHPVKMVEMDYSIADRAIENNGVLETARKNNIEILAFGVLCHGILSADSPFWQRAVLPPVMKEKMLGGLQKIADEKNTTVEKLVQAYVYARNPDMRIIIGTTRKEHLQDAIDALSIELTPDDIQRMEAAFPSDALKGMPMRNYVFHNGRVIQK